jgi:phospholipase C
MKRQDLLSNIDTIVILMLENRSFDHVLGHLRLPQYGNRQNIDGIDSLENPAFWNSSPNISMVKPFLGDDAPFLSDLPHERDEVKLQLAPTSAGQFTMTGFVESYLKANGLSDLMKPPPMGILKPDHVPITGFLAQQYMVCNRWFAPLPTSTHPNRLMAMSGYVRRDKTANALLPRQFLLFDWLDRVQVPWRVYSEGLSFFTLTSQMWPAMLTDSFRSFDQLIYDIQHEDEETFPNIIVVEPDYNDSPIHIRGHACDNHPPLPIAFGEQFLRRVYESVTANPQRWQKTLLIVTYDEHGGFYDHVSPLPIKLTPGPDAYFSDPFSSTGVRVPALLVSPWVSAGAVSDEPLDHTSILQLIAERFGPAGAAYSEAVDGRRQQGISSVATAIDRSAPRTAIPAVPATPIAAIAELTGTVRKSISPGQQAFAAAVQGFTSAHGKAAQAKFPELAHWPQRQL